MGIGCEEEMDYFNNYVSNTTVGSSSQTFFSSEHGVGRVFYRLSCGGRFQYSLLFSNIIDSTFSDGTISRANQICDAWQLHRVSYCVTKAYQGAQWEKESFSPFTFSGEQQKTVIPGEFFSTDAVEIEAESGDYLCIEITFSGRMIPCQQDINVPAFIYENGSFVPSKLLPVPQMIGCNRPVKKRIAYLGDSITQGLGTEENSYTHWNHHVSMHFGCDYAFWNLGIGFGRAADAASNGAWLFKAMQNDCVVVCFGVNDILQGAQAQKIKDDLLCIVSLLKERGIKVIIQTVPPFDYEEPFLGIWREVNTYIKETLSKLCNGMFDVVPILGNPAAAQMARYGGHPNAQGCREWANALIPVVEQVLTQV